MKKFTFARVTPLVIFFFLASCTLAQEAGNGNGETVFTDKPAIFRSTASTLALIIESIGILAMVAAVVLAGFFFFRNLGRQEFGKTYNDL